jgi:hypothetical protein
MVGGTEPLPELGLNSSVNVALSVVLGLVHRIHSNVVQLNLLTTWLTKSYGQGYFSYVRNWNVRITRRNIGQGRSLR